MHPPMSNRDVNQCVEGIEQPNGVLLPSVVIHGSIAPHSDDTGIYEAEDLMLCASANKSPQTLATLHARSQVDLVLPPATAFTKPGMLQRLVLL
jgi:hypothetical protein